VAGCVPPTWRPSLENDVWAARASIPRPTPVRPYDPRVPAYDRAMNAAMRAAALRWIPLGTPVKAALHTLGSEHFAFIVGGPTDPSMELEEERCLPWDCRGVRIELQVRQGRVADLTAEATWMDYDF